MKPLHQILASDVQEWRESGYQGEFSTIAEILEYQIESEIGSLRFLRNPQINALETYWYLRLVKKTPHVFDLYKQLYSIQSELLEALGLDFSTLEDLIVDEGIDELWRRIKTDDLLVKEFKLESLRETLQLDYPSYILALAMGAGKTILIGAIIATEFAMAIEHPKGPFVQNALVFAPGKTIIESLRELMQMPYERILPPRLYKPFAASVKLTFTRDGEKDVPIIRGSSFNIVVTNTEKIRIQKRTSRTNRNSLQLVLFEKEKQQEEEANLRLQAIASLPHLAVFSDEAHHTYGQSLDIELKKVRRTVDYLAANTNLICVVNTTGTPYFQRQSLKDVVIWYGLSEGIRDGILKDVAGNIQAYDFSGNAESYINNVIKDFFHDYGSVQISNGAYAKIALYFPQTDDLKELKPTIDRTLIEMGQDPSLCLINTSDAMLTKPGDIEAFNRLNDPDAPHRVILLVNKGTEGWNCPSLFACALVRKLSRSNNFVLQAATRCLRQVPANIVKARIYLSIENFGVLDQQLQEAYGETIATLNHANQDIVHTRISLQKVPPPLVLRQRRTSVERNVSSPKQLRFNAIEEDYQGLKKAVYTVDEQQSAPSVLRQIGGTVTLESIPQMADCYTVAVELAARYRLKIWVIYDALRELYGKNDIPLPHVINLAQQIEEQVCFYEIKEEEIEISLALIKPEGFIKDIAASGEEEYFANISYAKKDEQLLLSRDSEHLRNLRNIGFHYTPYKFDSLAELSFYEQMLMLLQEHHENIEDMYFTGAITDPSKTDFFVWYKDGQDKWRRYTPDFIIRKKSVNSDHSKCVIVEIKAEKERYNPIDGEQGEKVVAIRKLEHLNSQYLQYIIIFVQGDTVSFDLIASVLDAL